jgi:hypothetical protein
MNLKKRIIEATFVTALGVGVLGLGAGMAHAAPPSQDPPMTTWSQGGHGWYWNPGHNDGGWGGPWYYAPPPPPVWGYPGYYGGGWGHGWGWGC